MGAAHPAPEDDLEALFDQVAAEAAAKSVIPAPVVIPANAGIQPSNDAVATDVFHRVGTLTRNLHEALRELGYDKAVESAVGALPDARERLSYIANLTGKAAEKVLAAVEHGQAEQSRLEAESKELSEGWKKLMAGELAAGEFRTLALASKAFIDGMPERSAQSSALLTDIMMAQDFHDLTGQVIQKVVKVAQSLEEQLLKLLLEATPPEKRTANVEGFLTGPAMNAENRDDVVSGQGQVDDLLASLGF